MCQITLKLISEIIETRDIIIYNIYYIKLSIVLVIMNERILKIIALHLNAIVIKKEMKTHIRDLLYTPTQFLHLLKHLKF